MIRLNRSRFLGIICLTIFIYFLVFTDTGGSSSEFRASTEAALARKRQREQDLPLRGHLSDEDLTKKTHDELQGILNSPSREGIKKDEYGNTIGRALREPERELPSRVDLEREVANGEDPADVPQRKTTYKSKDTAARSEKEKALQADSGDGDAESAEDPGKAFVTKKLEEYLKSPVVIFSKSFCPHSKRAKQLLLDIYTIDPKPVVVELDMLGDHIPEAPHDDSFDHEEHSRKTLGKAMQEMLAERTGRRTVPNIVIGSVHSIGGNDNIWEMHASGTLAEEIKKFGGRRVISVDVHDPDDEGEK